MSGYILRPVLLKDLEKLSELAATAREALISLPSEKELLERKIKASILGFAGEENTIGPGLHLFVLEELSTQKLVGASALKSDNTYTEAFTSYYLKGDTEPPHSLKLVASLSQYTELATLFLHRDFRSKGLSSLLALGRYLFIAEFPNLFHKNIIARLRGARPSGNAPSFWTELGKAIDKNSYFPIHTNKFPEEVRNSIGKVHEKTEPAYHILRKQGFVCHQAYDLFDTGPRMKAQRDEVLGVKNSSEAIISESCDTLSSEEGFTALVAKPSRDFRCTQSQIKIFPKTPDHVIIPGSVMEQLSLQVGDRIRYLRLAAKRNTP